MSRQAATLVFTGDVFCDDDRVSLSHDVREFFAQADLVVANIEAPIVCRVTNPIPDPSRLRNGQQVLELLGQMSLSVGTLANNHMLDWGEAAMAATIRTLAEDGIAPIGAGLTADDARRPVTIECNGLKLAVVAYGAKDVGAIPAGPCTAGTNSATAEQMCRQIAELRKQVDHVIATIHWDFEHRRYPAPETRDLAKRLVEAGAVLVVGHHQHVVQGAEILTRGAVAYGLGNFVFSARSEGTSTRRLSSENRCGVVLEATLDREGIMGLRFHHTIQIAGNGLTEVQWDDRAERTSRLETLSHHLHLPLYSLRYRAFVAKRLAGKVARRALGRSRSRLSLGHLRALTGYLGRVLGRGGRIEY